jgi:hypothetical protein
MCEFRVGGIQLRTVVQCIIYVFGTEKPTSMAESTVWISVTAI